MKVMLIIILAVLALLFFILLGFGFFSRITIKRGEQGGERLVFSEAFGDYRKSGLLMDEIYDLLIREASLETFKGFGIFYDNPKEKATESLRYEAGCIIPETIQDLEKIERALGSAYKIKRLEPKECIYLEFPYKGKMSVFFGAMKVYPLIDSYLKQHDLPRDGEVMEIYDVPGKRIGYRKYL
jgi:hypothetical protein